MKKTVIFDIETGGLEAGVHPIIQIAAVAVDEEFKILEEFEVKLQFDVKDCEEKALEVNSYDPDVWNDQAVPQEDAMGYFSAFLKRHSTVMLVSKKGRPYYVALMMGHNAASFDGPYIQKWYRAADEFLPGYFRVMCTCQLAQWFFYNQTSQPKDMKLGTLCEWFGIDLPEEAAHDALADVRANAQLAATLLLATTVEREGK